MEARILPDLISLDDNRAKESPRLCCQTYVESVSEDEQEGEDNCSKIQSLIPDLDDLERNHKAKEMPSKEPKGTLGELGEALLGHVDDNGSWKAELTFRIGSEEQC